jgi:hypothetical protein
MEISSMKELLRIAIMPMIYFGCVLVAAMGAAFDVLPSIPVWSLPIFAALATIAAVSMGARLPQVLITFVAIVAIFPLGLLYLVGRAGRLSPAETLSILAAEPGVSGWLWMISPIVAAAVTFILTRRLVQTS